MTRCPPARGQKASTHSTDSAAEIGHADLRGTRTPPDHLRGRIVLCVRKGRSHVFRVTDSHPEASGQSLSEERMRPLRGAKALCRDARHGQRPDRYRTGLAPAQAPIRNIVERIAAVRVCVPSGARGPAAAYAEVRGKVLRGGGSSAVRAATQVAGRRFDSGSSTTG